MTGSLREGKHCMQEHLYEHSYSDGHNSFLEDVAITPEVVVQMRSVEKAFLVISQNLQENTCARLVLTLIFIYLSSWTGKAFNLFFLKSSILVQIALYFSNSFSSSIQKDINLLFPSLILNVLTYPLILGIIKTNGLIVLSKYQIKYLEFCFGFNKF